MADNYVGQIALFAHSRIPGGWAACDGATLPIQTNAALYSLIGNNFGGDGKTNFKLPDLRGRTPLGGGHGSPPISYNLYGGAPSVQLTANTLPPHRHALIADAADGISANAGGNYYSAAVLSMTNKTAINLYASSPTPSTLVPLNKGSVTSVGGAESHDNMQPYLALQYCICIAGTYPAYP